MNYEQHFHKTQFPIKNAYVDYTKPHWNLNQVPVIGPWAARIGQVNRIWATPCAISPMVMVEALFWNLPGIAVDLFKPELLLIQKGKLGVERPSSNRPGSHARAGKRKGRFNINQLLNPKLQPEAPPAARTRALALFDITGELALRIGWYMIVVDATTQGLVNWSSTVYQWSGCMALDPTPAEGEQLPIPNFAGMANGRLGWNVLNDGNGILDASTVKFPPNFEGWWGFTATFRPTGFFYHPFELPQLSVVAVHEVDEQPLKLNYVDDEAHKGTVFRMDNKPFHGAPTGWQIRYDSTPGTWFACDPFHIWAQPRFDTALKPDP